MIECVSISAKTLSISRDIRLNALKNTSQHHCQDPSSTECANPI